MVNRTLRRAYGGTRESTGELSGIIDGDVGSKQDSAGTVSADDSATVIDGTDAIGDTERISGGIGSVEIDPNELDEFIARDRDGSSDGNVNGDGTRKRRKRGPNKRTTGARKAQETVEPFLLMAHQWAAVFLKTPEIALAPDEAKQLSDAYSTFCEYHEIPILSPKRMSEINMIAALLLVYAPRVVAVRNRIRSEKVERAKNVTPKETQIYGVK